MSFLAPLLSIGGELLKGLIPGAGRVISAVAKGGLGKGVEQFTHEIEGRGEEVEPQTGVEHEEYEEDQPIQKVIRRKVAKKKYMPMEREPVRTISGVTRLQKEHLKTMMHKRDFHKSKRY